jgi:RNA recognition motif-containing protein
MATKLYLGKTKDILKEDLKVLVSRYGLVRSFEDKESYCFVDYYYESDARIAQVELDGQILNGCKLVAQFSKGSVKMDDISKEALPSQAKRVYVGNLNYKFTHQELHSMFSRMGVINELIHKDTYSLIVMDKYHRRNTPTSNQQRKPSSPSTITHSTAKPSR